MNLKEQLFKDKNVRAMTIANVEKKLKEKLKNKDLPELEFIRSTTIEAFDNIIWMWRIKNERDE